MQSSNKIEIRVNDAFFDRQRLVWLRVFRVDKNLVYLGEYPKSRFVLLNSDQTSLSLPKSIRVIMSREISDHQFFPVGFWKPKSFFRFWRVWSVVPDRDTDRL